MRAARGIVWAFAAIVSVTAPRAAPAEPCAILSGAMTAAPRGPVFLPSYPTAHIGGLRDTAFLYDNAVAAIALAACGKPEQGRRIGDAMLLALDGDSFWHDGRLRNAYAPGVMSKPVKLAGWWDARQNMWIEDRYQAGSDTGNLAWAMLALLTLDNPGHRYLAGALRIGAWIAQRADKHGGFTGGTFGFEPQPYEATWKATEHNVDLVAAYRRLAQATGDKHWMVRAQAAESFVGAMWSANCNCFAAGTGPDGVTPNRLIALDAQVWPLLAIPGAVTPHGAVIATIDTKLTVPGGFSYGEARGGIWTEGTAQVALLMALTGKEDRAAALNRTVAKMASPDGYYATDVPALATGFALESDKTQGRVYFHLPHLAATAWAALAQARFNPFTATHALP